MIILDTNVLSEGMRDDRRISDWINTFPRNAIYITATTLGELYYGVHLLPDGQRKSSLKALVDSVSGRTFAGRILAFDAACSEQFGLVKAIRRSLGRPIGDSDAIIAATALVFRFQLATRNTRDFDGLGLALINPFEERA